MLSFVRYYHFVEILSCPTYREESSRLRPLRHRGFHNRYNWWCNRRFHNKWWCNKRLKQFVCSRCQFCGLSHQWINNDCLQTKNLKVQVPVFISNISNLSCSYTLRPLRHRYSFHFRCLTDKIALTLQVYFATSNGHKFICKYFMWV